MSNSAKGVLVIFCFVAAIFLHLTMCSWRKLEEYRSHSISNGTTRVYAGRDDNDDIHPISGLEHFMNRLGEGIDRQAGAIWLHTDEWGKGVGLYARSNMDKDTARWLGVIFPIGLVVLVPFILAKKARE